MSNSNDEGRGSRRPVLPLGDARMAHIHEHMFCCGNDVDRCARYEEPGVRFRKCSRCQFVSYCSKECQISDWKRHKSQCKHMANGVGPAMRKRLVKLMRSNSANACGIAACIIYCGCQGRGKSPPDDDDEEGPPTRWAASDDPDGPRRPTFPGCDKGVHLPLYIVNADWEKLGKVALPINDGMLIEKEPTGEEDESASFLVGLAEDGLSLLYTGTYLQYPSQVAVHQHQFSRSRRLDDACPGLLYLKALQYDLTATKAEGAFFVEYNIEDPFGGVSNIFAVTRFYHSFQINEPDTLNTNSLLKFGPPGRHANVDSSWMQRYGISRVAELSYTACDTNWPGGLAGRSRPRSKRKQATRRGRPRRFANRPSRAVVLLSRKRCTNMYGINSRNDRSCFTTTYWRNNNKRTTRRRRMSVAMRAMARNRT